MKTIQDDVHSEVNDLPTKQVDLSDEPAEDAVFGAIGEDGPNYRNVGWLGSSALMMKTQIGLGVLSIPAAFDALGLIPGLLGLIAIGTMTTWCNFVVGSFKLNHREIYGVDDAAGLMFGRIGREIFAAAFCLSLIFASGSGMLGIAIAFNAISTHGACTAIFVAVAAIIVICFSSIRTLHRMTWLAWVGLFSLIIACFMVAIAVGVQDRPDAAPREGPWTSDYKIIGNPTFEQAVAAFSTFVFAYAGTPLFFPIVAEMRDPREYKKALILCQVVVTITYITVGIVIYYFCGSYVASPSLGSAGKLIKQISYGLALPGLVAGSTLNAHMGSKLFFIRFLRGSKHLVSNSLVHWSTWITCVVGVCGTGYIIASAVPIFGSLVALIGALLATLQCFIPTGCMWLYDNWAKRNDPSQRTRLWTFQVVWAVFIVVAGSFLMVSGTYGSIVGIIEAYQAEGGTAAWSCADNSNSV